MQRTSFDKSILKNRSILLYALMILFSFGMIYGALLVKYDSSDVIEGVSIITNGYKSIQAEQPIFKTFINTFCASMLLVIVPYLCGYSAIGQIGALLLPFFHGLGLGCTLGYLYQNYGFKGIGYSMLIVIPHSVIALFAMLVACRESVKLSNLFFQSFIPCDKAINLNTIKLYNVKFLVLSAFVFGSAVIHALTVLLFSGLFREFV